MVARALFLDVRNRSCVRGSISWVSMGFYGVLEYFLVDKEYFLGARKGFLGSREEKEEHFPGAFEHFLVAREGFVGSTKCFIGAREQMLLGKIYNGVFSDRNVKPTFRTIKQFQNLFATIGKKVIF